jgi:hypothetical protein
MRAAFRDLHRLGMASAVAVLIAVVALMAKADSISAAATFNPTTSVTAANTTAGAVSDITNSFNVPDGDVNFAFNVFFIPPDWGIKTDAEVPDGAIAVTIDASVSLGLISGACNSALSVSFNMMDATTNASVTDVFEDTDNDDIPQMMEDKDGDGLPDAVTAYPDFLTRIFPGETPIARLHGQTAVSGVAVSLGFVIFDKDKTTLETPIGTLTHDPRLGYPTVVVLQAIGDPEAAPAPSPITDFCTPLSTTITTLGTASDNVCTAAGGPDPALCKSHGTDIVIGAPGSGTTPNEETPYFENPAAGTYNFVTYAVGQRDADGDGIENGLDPCALEADTWDPRLGSFGTAQPGDSDGDRIPGTCDEEPNTPKAELSADVDFDRYENTGDNCPQVANGESASNQADGDLDQIGDDCDPNPTTPDGNLIAVCIFDSLDIGGGGTAPVDPNTVQPCDPTAEIPVADTDDDDDGVPNADDRCPNTPAGAEVNAVGCTPEQAVLDDDNDGVLNASDSCPGTAAGADVDANGCSAAQLAGNDGPDNSGDGGVGGSGVGALAPAVGSIPAWAAIASGLGGAGILGSLAAFGRRFFGIRRRD